MQETITEIRNFNRLYTNVLGLLDRHILASDYSLAEARTLFEIRRSEPCSANKLSGLLLIDRSNMSRILSKLERQGLIMRSLSETDNRVHLIKLTNQGHEAFDYLDARSNEQIAALFRRFSAKELDAIRSTMNLMARRLSDDQPIVIRSHTDSDFEYVVKRHKTLYAQEYGLSSVFAAYAEKVIREFAHSFEEEKEHLFIAEHQGKPVGSLAVAHSDDQTGQLRFFLIEPEMRGKGLGQKLMDNALSFCHEKGYKHVFLETISALSAARHIYRSRGFAITQTHTNPQWGKEVLEERWEMDL